MVLDTNGKGPGEGLDLGLDLNTRSRGLVPTSLIIALVLATPVPRVRRAWGLFWGLLCYHGFIFVSIAVWLLQEPEDGPGGLALFVLPPFSRAMVNHLTDLLLLRTSLAFVIVLIWILVTLRRQDVGEIVESETKN